MKKNKHKTPSRERYEKNNPVWSVRMPKEWIKEVAFTLKDTGQSRREFMEIALEKQMIDYERLKKKWNNEELSKIHNKKVEEKIKYPIFCKCYDCGKIEDVAQNLGVLSRILEKSKIHNLFYCSECIKNYKPR